MKAKEVDHYRSRLLGLRKRLMHEVETTEEALREDVGVPGALTKVPTHPADASIEGFDEQVALAQNEEGLFEEVEAALERIEAGTFGKCEDCGCDIPKERLDSVPFTRWCIDCARSHANESDAAKT